MKEGKLDFKCKQRTQKLFLLSNQKTFESKNFSILGSYRLNPTHMAWFLDSTNSFQTIRKQHISNNMGNGIVFFAFCKQHERNFFKTKLTYNFLATTSTIANILLFHATRASHCFP